MPTVPASQTRTTHSSYRTPAHVASDLTRTSVSATTDNSLEAPLSILPSLTPPQHDDTDSAVHGQHKPEAGDVPSATEIEEMEARYSSDSLWTE